MNTNAVRKKIIQRWPALAGFCACPSCGRGHVHIASGKENLYAVIVDLNNEHDWTREQIADWLEAQGL